ncbi:MAG: helix-turn-helix transcriptional regulator [Actinobacteria bacterium]|uniref:HTH cro/C1-type domain-containing protein n=2 Tax=Nostocoides veronense TaxID=330836 RepID=A0ABN2M819_9MICO|nr:helix-turn-helix transcriptional regulator [Actinomycetota bacterium]
MRNGHLAANPASDLEFPPGDMTFAHRLATTRKHAGLTQQALADTIGIHVTQLRRYEAGTSQPTLDVLRALARALACSIDHLAFDDERGPATPGLRVQLEALDRLTPDEQATVAAMIEGALLRHQVRQINVS